MSPSSLYANTSKLIVLCFAIFTIVSNPSRSTCHSLTLLTSTNPTSSTNTVFQTPFVPLSFTTTNGRRRRRKTQLLNSTTGGQISSRVRSLTSTTTGTVLHSKRNDDGDTSTTSTNNNQTKRKRIQRSEFLTTTATFLLLTTTTTISPQPANALQQKNEVLCGTGFFEHFNEFRCTPIGDISDEGTSRKLSTKESEVSDGLMGKLGDFGDVFGDDDTDGGGGKKKKDGGKDSGGSGRGENVMKDGK